VAVHHHRSSAAAVRTVAELRERGGNATALAADLTDEAQCRDLVPQVVREFGRIDAVVNNASLFEFDDVGSFSYAAMERHWRANTGPAILLARALHDSLAGDPAAAAAQGNGVVVNIVDQKLWNPNPDYLSYTLSKAALECATTLLAQALAPRLRVCGVAPGVTLPSGPMSGHEFDAAHTMTPLRRSSTPDDIAQAVRFLLESAAITGCTLLVDGGQHLQRQPRDVMFLAQPGADPKGA
jgi:NAD(P)-dependent dehydrogenase (short-subunit alcohol dehydrogenase family)